MSTVISKKFTFKSTIQEQTKRTSIVLPKAIVVLDNYQRIQSITETETKRKAMKDCYIIGNWKEIQQSKKGKNNNLRCSTKELSEIRDTERK